MPGSSSSLLRKFFRVASRTWRGGLALLGLLLAIAGWELWRRPGAPPELEPKEMELALGWVHEVLAAKISGSALPANPPRELVARTSVYPVFVSFYGEDVRGRTHPLVGYWAPREAAESAPLDQALAIAAADLGRRMRESQVPPGRPGTTTLKVDLAGRPRRLWLRSQWYLEKVLDRGRHGVLGGAADRWAFVLPARSVEHLSDWRDVVHELEQQAGASVPLSSFATTSFVEGPPEEPGALPVFRGNVLLGEVTAKAVRRSLLDAAGYLARMIGPDGRYCYVYVPYEDGCESDYNLLRHAGTTYSLYQLMGVFEKAEFAPAGERATEWLRAQVRLVEGDPSRAFLLEGDRAKLGAVGLAVLSLVERERVMRDGHDRELLGKLGRFLVSEAREDGYMRSYFPWRPDVEVPAQNSIYYQGEALLGMVRLYQLSPDPSILAAAGRVANFLVHHRWKWAGMELFVPPDAWLAQALAELDAISPAAWLRDYAHRIIDITDLTMLRDSEGAAPDLVGGPASGPYFPGVTPAGARNEATTSVWRMARRRGETAQAARLHELGLRSARFQLSQQFRPANSYFLANPPRARGGFRGSPVDSRVRIDYVQHNVTGLIGVLEMLENAP